MRQADGTPPTPLNGKEHWSYTFITRAGDAPVVTAPPGPGTRGGVAGYSRLDAQEGQDGGEPQDEASLLEEQRQAITRQRYLVLVVTLLAAAASFGALVFISGFSAARPSFPYWIVFVPVAIGLGGVLGLILLRLRWINLTARVGEGDRRELAAHHQKQGLFLTPIPVFFLALFLLTLPITGGETSPMESWFPVTIEGACPKNTCSIPAGDPIDISVFGTDSFGATTLRFELEVVRGPAVVAYLGLEETFANISGDNEDEVQSNALVYSTVSGGDQPAAVKRWSFRNTDLETDLAPMYHAVRIYNNDLGNESVVKLSIFRDIAPLVSYAGVGLFAAFTALALVWILLLHQLRMGPATPAESARGDVEADGGPGLPGPAAPVRAPSRPAGPPSGPAPDRAVGGGFPQTPGRGVSRPIGGGPPATAPPPPRPVFPGPAPVATPARPPVQAPTAPRPQMVPPAAPGGAPSSIACPRCKKQFTVTRRDGPTPITCPHCGKTGSLPARKPAAAAAPAAPAPRPAAAPPAAPRPAPPRAAGPATGGPRKTIACPACKRQFAVTDGTRPLTITCPHCGKSGTLR